MKKVLFIFAILFLTFTSLKGQTNVYHPFPDSNAIWREHYYDNNGHDHYQFGIIGDTIIKSLKYHKLYVEHNCLMDTAISISNANLVGAIREDSLKRIYFYNFAFFAPSDSIYQLYDFSVQVGDTVRFEHNYSFSFPYLVVDSIDSVLTYDHYRKRYYLIADSWPHVETWIEGIGSLRSLLSGIMPYPTCFCVWENVCYKYLNTTYYLNPPFLDCYDMSYGINDNHTISQKISISPNPFSQSTQITLPQTYHSISLAVYNIQGKQVAQQQYADCDKIQLNRNQLSNGLYFLKLTLDDKAVETGKIVISE